MRLKLNTVAWFLVGCLAAGAARGQGRADYSTQIKPLLRERCYACHGALKQEADLRLDTVEAMKKAAVLEAGNVDGSLILARVSDPNPSSRMPPEHEGEPFSAEQIELLRTWIRSGADAPENEVPEKDAREHWAFQPVVRPVFPEITDRSWLRNPIDAFVSFEHARHELQAQPEADRWTLARRLYYDLSGLPPAPDELVELEGDESSDWYDRLVDRLIASPRYGERWGRHWMDVWRYSDAWGLGDELRNSQRHIWHWRDWIVESLNANVGFDEMLRQMLAADELYAQDLSRLRATGFLARNYFLFSRNQWLEETVEHVSKGMLGLTVNCAKCHDHKYDPILHADFYRMRAFFEPYHVRLDMLPGEANLDRNGLPRVFDGLLDPPTYRFLQGNEFKPDQSKIIRPGVPSMISFGELSIEPVSLPAEAWRPEQRSWILTNYRSAALSNIESTTAAVAKAEAKLMAADSAERKIADDAGVGVSHTAATDTEMMLDVDDSFESLITARWLTFGGNWLHESGGLRQQLDGPTRSGLRLLDKAPADFDVTVRYTVLGGSQWRSVGLVFDNTQSDPGQPPAGDDNELLIYTSSVAAGPVVRGAYLHNGMSVYPSEAHVARKIELQQEHVLRLQVRDTLINVTLDGEFQFAWRSPIARRSGYMQLITFDAIVEFHQFKLTPLSKEAELREAIGPASPLMIAKAELAVARQSDEVARLQLTSIDARGAATEAQANVSESPQSRSALARAAVRAERLVASAIARKKILEIELKILTQPDKRQALDAELVKAREDHEKSVSQIDDESESFAVLAGARWTKTRFIHPDRDDPPIVFPETSSGRRSALAKWLTDPRQPLTARVAMNRIWMHHMGRPLVSTIFDFGRKGSPPTHPDLLDWLSHDWVGRGWDLKRTQRSIVLSTVYRQSSAASNQRDLQNDPDNRWYWRQNPVRLESQAVRDSILAHADLLDLKLGGPPVPANLQDASSRRSLYFYHSNNDRNAFLTVFDEAAVRECYRRDQSIVPQQALAMSNSRLVSTAARQMAQRLSNDDRGRVKDDLQFVKLAFQQILAIVADEDQIAASLEFLRELQSIPELSAENDAQLRARSNFVQALFNHNDFVTVR